LKKLFYIKRRIQSHQQRKGRLGLIAKNYFFLNTMQDMQSMRRYRFFLLIAFSLLSLEACRERTDDIIDSNGSVPLLVKVSISPNTVVNTDLIGTQPRSPNDTLSLILNIQAKVVDADGESSIFSVPFSVVNGSTQSILTQGVLADNGIAPDSKSNDSLFSGYALVSLPRSFVGSLNVIVQALSANGFTSSSIISPVIITRTNHPPFIESVTMPDTVHSVTETSMTMTVQVSDSDGIGDISAVYQITQNGTHYQLTDDGNGSYSRTITWIPSDTFSGTYIYSFVAYDKSQTMSNVVTDTLVVMP
jgi:hypothetical protein